MSPKTSRRSGQRPFVLINMAMTADGKIATANRAVTSFGSPEDLRALYRLRATADAILCGARTLEETGATLGNGGDHFRRQRLRRGLAAHPLRILVTGSGSLDPDAAVFRQRFSPIILLTTGRASAARLRRLGECAEVVKVGGAREINFPAVFRWLWQAHGVRRLLCEGGGELNDALFRAGLVDEIHLTVCPKIFGGRTAPTIADGAGFLRIAQAARFEIKSIREKKAELFTVFSRVNSGRVG